LTGTGSNFGTKSRAGRIIAEETFATDDPVAADAD
jgi:hypothetical protein